MGTITYYKENLFHTDRKVIAHGVNCKGVFGAGVASQVAQRFPDVKRGYVRRHLSEGWKPGDCQFILTENKMVIVNMATQEKYGKNKDFVDYDAVKQCFEKVLDYCLENGEGLTIPKVGAGLAGGDWAKIEKILKDLLVTRDVEVDVYYL